MTSKVKLIIPGRWDFEYLSYDSGSNVSEITLEPKPIPSGEFLKELDETLAHPETFVTRSRPVRDNPQA
jgi:hypothetical protein